MTPETRAEDSANMAPNRGFDKRLAGWSRLPLIPVAVIIIAAAFIPLAVSNNYYLDVLILIMIYAILNQSWSFTIGIVGAWNFGQLGLYAIGGYAAGIAVLHLGFSPWLAFMIAPLVAAVANLFIAIPSMRLRGVYVALLTFAFAEVLRLIILNDNSGFSGGIFGLSVPSGLFDKLSLQMSERAFYWLCLALCVATALLIRRLTNSPFGLAFLALRDSPRYAVSLGISMRTYYVVATTFAAALAGIAGALYVFKYSTIGPTVMGLGQLSFFLFMIMLGGLGTYSGPIIGTALVVVFNEFLKDYGDWRLLILGVVLLVVLILLPRGLAPLGSRVATQFGAWINEDKKSGAASEEPATPTRTAADESEADSEIV
jgi:branched-chain amino acid transport system permease protein